MRRRDKYEAVFTLLQKDGWTPPPQPDGDDA